MEAIAQNQAAPPQVAIHTYRETDSRTQFARCASTLPDIRSHCFSHHPSWLKALQAGLGHSSFLLEARADNDRALGWLPLALVQSKLFGRFLVSLPYLNSAGIASDNAAAGYALIERAVQLADELDVRYLELRHEHEWRHPALTHSVTTKAHLRLPLPQSCDDLWHSLDAKVRNQIRKAQKNELSVHWGGIDLLPEFHAVFSRNMRDLGTPTYGRSLFKSILSNFPDRAELCVVRQQSRPLAVALLVHGDGQTEVPSASSRRRYNLTNANMLMYWHLLVRALERGQHTFDFGRSSFGSNTYRFKQQWGAQPHGAIWQYYLRRGSIDQARPDNPRYRMMVNAWRHLPLWLSRLIGPAIVKGIP